MVDGCVAGAAVVELCEKGDKLILEETSKVYKKEKEMRKGESCTEVRGQQEINSSLFVSQALLSLLASPPTTASATSHHCARKQQ